MSVLYTDIDPCCGALLRERVRCGHLPAGDVAVMDVRGIRAEHVVGRSQVHLFCGMGGSPVGLSWCRGGLGWLPGLRVLTGGFPCQDISSAGKGAGLDGAKSGLFWEMCRVLDLYGPDVALAENVGALSRRGLDRVARALGERGFAVHAFRVGAWAVRSPQRRERWWIVAVAKSVGCGARTRDDGGKSEARIGRGGSGGGGKRGDQRGRLEHKPGEREGRLPAGSGRSGTSEIDAVGRSQGCGLVHVCGAGLRAIRSGGAPGADADLAGARGGLGDGTGAGLQGLGDDAGGAQVAQPGRAGEPCHQWPHKRWERYDPELKRWVTIRTPQHQGEPPRKFPGTQAISARWRCCLMGYPQWWLDVTADELAALNPRYASKPEKMARWWNTQGVKMTGNAQVPQCVHVVMQGLIDGLTEIGVAA